MVRPLIRHAGEGRHAGERGDGYRLFAGMTDALYADSAPRLYLLIYLFIGRARTFGKLVLVFDMEHSNGIN